MCINDKVSMATFLTCTFTCIYLYIRNNVNDRWISIIFFYLGFMQLLEYFMWIDQECKGINQIATNIGLWHNLLQPISSIAIAYIFTNGKLPLYVYLPFIAYMLISVPRIYNAKQENQCSKPCKNDSVGLSWEYTKTKDSSLVWVLFVFALAIPFLTMPKNGILYTSIIFISFIISNMISSFRCPGKYNIPTSGSWWCLMAFTLPILSIFINKN